MEEIKKIIIPIIEEDDNETPEGETFATRREQREIIKKEQEKEGIKLYEKYRETILYLATYPKDAYEKTKLFKGFIYQDFENAIGRRLLHLRNLRGLSKADIYKTTRTDRVNYDRIEKGDTVPRITTLLKILQVLDITLYDFFYPIKYEEWERSDNYMLYTPPKDIFEMRKRVREELSGPLGYWRNGSMILLSGKTREIFVNAVESAFDMLDLINPDDT